MMATTMPNVDSMVELAARTGGRAYYNTNDIGRAIGRAVDDARVTYVLGYYPTNESWDGKFRTLKVTIRRGDADIRHRSGYLAIPAADLKQTRLVDLARAPMEATAIGLTVSVPDGDERSAGTTPVAVRVDPRGVTMRRHGDTWDAALDILIAHSTATGELIPHLETTLNLRLTNEQHDQLLGEGFTMSRTVDLRRGATRIHVVVRDRDSGAAGSVVVPLGPSR
jgi:hypothetical protein